MKRIALFLNCSVFCVANLFAQEKSISDYVSVDGFIKNLVILNFGEETSGLSPTNLLHQRLNLKVTPTEGLTMAASLRTRFFISDLQKYNPDFGKHLSADSGLVDLSFTLADHKPFILYTMLDRLYLDWRSEKWNIRLGRQRLNWGMNLAWNPNDIFNTYNFLDFDYEERPGADALKVQYHFSAFTNIELAYSPSRNKEGQIGALKFAFNKRSYDFQVITGNYQTDAYLGLGWAGSIKDAGWKGEVSFFQNWKEAPFDQSVFVGSFTADYAFKKGWYLAGAFLYNNRAADQLYSTAQLLDFNLSPKRLMPGKYNFLVQSMKEFSPSINAGLALIYSPKINLFIINPSFSYRIKDNWEMDIILQSFMADNLFGKFDNLGNSLTLRGRWSFAK